MTPSHHGNPATLAEPIRSESARESVDLIKALPAAVYTCDPEGYLDTWNAAAVELWGRAPEKGETRWCGSCRILRADGSELPFEGSPMALVLRNGQWTRGEEIQIQRADGSLRRVIPCPELLHDREGMVTGAVNMLVDITDRKKAEEAQELASRLPMENPSPVMRLSEGRTVEFANPAAESILESWGIGAGGEVPEFITRQSREALASGEKATIEIQIDTRTYLLRIAPVTSAASVNLYFNDITERKRSEATLAEMKEESDRKRRLYEGLLTTTPDLAYVFDLQHRFTYANDALLAMWGKTWEESRGKTCLELGYEPWHAAMHDREIDEIAKTKRPIRGEVPFFHETLGRRIYDYILTPLLGVDGEVEAVAGVTRDVTERKLAEERAEFLSELTGKLTSLSDEGEIIKVAVESLGKRLRAHRCYFVEFLPQQDLVSVENDWTADEAPGLSGTYAIHEFGSPEWWQHYSLGRFAVEDVRTNPLTLSHVQAYQAHDVLSYAAHPFHADESRIVALAVTSRTPRVWSDSELSLLEHVVARVWPLVERVRSEAALRESRRQMSLVSDHVPALISYLDHQEIFRFANGKYHEWFGLKPDELQGMHLKQLLGEEIYKQRAPYVARVLHGQAVKFEGPTQHRVLGRRDLELSYVPDFGPDADIRGFYVMAMDITERKKTEKQLEHQARRLRLLWEAAGVILTAENPDTMLQRVFGKISPLLEVDTFFNFMVNGAGDALALQACHGVPDEALPGLARLEFGQAICGNVAKHRKAIVACSIHESDHPMVQLVKGFGIRAYACNPLMAGDELIGTLSFASRTRTEFDTDEIEFMETICHYITGAYVRWKLLEDLRAADRRKDEFLATLAHELRNPLAPIRTGLEVMRMAGGNLSAIERIRITMERQVEQLVTLVNDLMDVSRITRGKLQLRKSRVEIAEVVRSAVEASQPVITEAGHRLATRLPEGPVILEADPHRLAQVISNLLNNAAKYTDQGGDITLEVAAHESGVSVSISDNGIGIPPAMLERIFEMFAQIDAPGTGDYGGLGIGLTLVKSLVEMHGGGVQAESKGLGHGSRFSFTLPVLSPSHGEAPPKTEAASHHATRRKVLVVDDNKAAADTLAMAVDYMGHEVKVASNGVEGLQLAESFLPEIVLMDLGMPVMDGWEAARQLRGQPWAKDMVIVALTGWGQDEDRRKTKEAGFDHHLVKPASPAAIRQLLDSAVKVSSIP